MSDTAGPDLSFRPIVAVVLSLPLLLLLGGVPVWLYYVLHGGNPVEATLATGGGTQLAVIVGGIVVHEMLHGLGWMWAAGVPWSAVSFRVHWKTLSPYAHLDRPIRARAYRIGGAVPGVVTGVIPSAFGILIGSAEVTGYGALLLTFAGGDLLILLRSFRVSAETMVQDHPVRFGAEVVDEQPGVVGADGTDAQ